MLLSGSMQLGRGMHMLHRPNPHAVAITALRRAAVVPVQQHRSAASAADRWQCRAQGPNPLAVALDTAKEQLQVKVQEREALEAEAQVVAQLAVTAAEVKRQAKQTVFEVVGMVEESSHLQQQMAELVAALQEKISAAPLDQRAALKAELSAGEARMGDIQQQLTSLRTKLEELYAKAVEAETVSAKADQVAAAAMQAAEQAVKEEMLAVSMVKGTEDALTKTDVVAGTAAAVSPPEAPIAKTAAATAATPTSLYADDGMPLQPMQPGVNWAGVGTVALLAAVSWWALNNTAPGLELLATLNGLVSVVAEKVSHIHVHDGEKGVVEAIWLLLSSTICVPLVVKLLPGGSPVLGYLLGGAIVGPYALGLIQDVQSVKHLAELGVVFLLFNIGLELSLDRLQSMAKYVFGMGSVQVALTLVAIAYFGVTFAGLSGASAIILGGALAMSSTAVAIQVLEDRGEMGSRHGRATFSVLLLQDLAVVVLLMLIPLLAPSPDGSSGGFAKIAQALGVAAVKACVCIVGIIAGGRVFIQPLYKKMSAFANAEIFAGTTLLVLLGTSVITSLAGLSLALGAFLAGLLIAETEYAMQVESDIAPYKGLLLGLFFMSVGMEISAQLFMQRWKEVLLSITILIVGKVAVMVAAGTAFGVSRMASLRSGLLLAPGGEFAFVAFGESVARGVLPAALTNELYLVVALSMALTPYLAELGALLSTWLDKGDVKLLQPDEGEMKERQLNGHVIIAGYGRAGQLIGQLLSENLVPYVALDVSNERVATGKAQDLPVFFGDAGSPAVLHLVGAERASCAVIALDTPGANYRAVWAMTKHFPHVKTFVRAHDLVHALNLEKAGATAVVPEILEPSLQLAAAALKQLDWKEDEVRTIMENFRRSHLQELQALTVGTGQTMARGGDL